MAADFGALVVQLREEGLGQRTNEQEKGLKKSSLSPSSRFSVGAEDKVFTTQLLFPEIPAG